MFFTVICREKLLPAVRTEIGLAAAQVSTVLNEVMDRDLKDHELAEAPLMVIVPLEPAFSRGAHPL